MSTRSHLLACAVLTAALLVAWPNATCAAPHGGGGRGAPAHVGPAHGVPAHGVPAHGVPVHGGYSGAYRPGYSGYYGVYSGYHHGYYNGYHHGYNYPGYYRPYGSYGYYYPSIVLGISAQSFYSNPFGGYYDSPDSLYSPIPPAGDGPDGSRDPSTPLDPNAADNQAHLRLSVPANAMIWFNGARTSQTGTERDFVSPVLTPGKEYTYEVRVRWQENGQVKERTRTLNVHANDWLRVDFTR